MFQLFARRLYLRIWLAVVGGVAVLTLLVAWAWQTADEYSRNNTPAAMARELSILDDTGQVLVQGTIQRDRAAGAPSTTGVVRFFVEGQDGRSYRLEMSPRPGGPARPGNHEWAFWLRPPFGFLWILGLVGVSVALGVFPIIRRLMQRLERLQRGVQRFGEGDLSVRVETHGQDEVADLGRQFNAAAQRIETLVRTHKSLLANASHELRSPLTRIRMGLELMGDGVPTPAFRAEIERNIAELDQLVDEILLASRLEAREADFGAIEETDLIGLCAEECARIEAELNVESSQVDVQGVPKLLRRAIRNLLENARRYSSADITLQLHAQAQEAWIQVMDRGPGVPFEQRERIFEPFYRMPGSSERTGGVGLGLALVRSIAERHGGRVYCEAREGGGACFVLRLPLASDRNT